ncbi:MAG: SulP family inorganic anion transporter [Verrucomicrobiota bacterium]
MDLSPLRSSLANFPKTSSTYLRTDLRADPISGLTVAVMGVPQAMAYALIAGLPPVWGLYTAMVTCTVSALLGSSSHLVTGPTNALCMVILSLTAHLPEKYGISLLEIVLYLTFLTGLIQFVFGLLRLGGIIRYVSHSVVIGFTSGAGILIAFNQIKNILGIQFEERPEHFIDVVVKTIQHLPDSNYLALTLRLITALSVIFLPQINKRIPGALAGIAISGALAYFLGWHLPEMGAGPMGKVEIVKDIEPISANLNLFRFPQLLLPPPLELTRELGLGAAALAILGLIEAASISRAVASQSGQRLDFNREFIGQGMGNLVGSFFSSFAGSGSFTRTAVCYKSGGRTRMAAVFSALWTAITILLFAGIANYIPKASLAGLLIVVAYTMVDKKHLKVTWKSGKHSRMVLFGTLVSTLVLPLEYAIFIGVFLSIIILLRVTGQIDLTQLVQRPDTGFDEVPFSKAPQSEVVTVNMEGDLYFAAAEDLDYELLDCLTPKTRVVILRMKRLRAVGSTAMAILERFHHLLHARNIQLVVCGIEDSLKKVMTGSGLRKKLGEQNLFYADNKLFQSTELALARAWSIVEMERRRKEAIHKTDTQLDTSITAGTLLSKKILRFGNQHQIREATWLISEMMKRQKSKSAQPLFLQDREGKLDSELTLNAVLKTLLQDVDESEVDTLSDEELAAKMQTQFQRSISETARSDLPEITENTSLATTVWLSRERSLKTLPVSDNDGRLTGLINPTDMLKGLGQALDFNPEKELPQPYIK